MKKGKLYLIPTTLGEGSENKNLPPTVIELIKNINVFIVENIRTSRRFIKKFIRIKISIILFFILMENTIL